MPKPNTSSRAVWTGAITFGLVTIPVKLLVAVREESVSFHMLHDQDHARLQRKMVCSVDGKEVHSEHTVKGYEIAPDQYVIISQEELESVQATRTKTIEIVDFVNIGEIDPIYYDQPYYVVPQETGAKPYRLLVEAMEQAHRVGIARFVMRSREQLVALRPKEGGLVMETMHFDDEVVSLADVEEVPRNAKSDPRELKMAQQLIDQLAGKFDPTKYHDEYVKAVREMVQRKAAGEQVVSAPQPKEATGRATNLLEALQASLSKARTAAGKVAQEPASARKTNPDERSGRRERSHRKQK